MVMRQMDVAMLPGAVSTTWQAPEPVPPVVAGAAIEAVAQLLSLMMGAADAAGTCVNGVAVHTMVVGTSPRSKAVAVN